MTHVQGSEILKSEVVCTMDIDWGTLCVFTPQNFRTRSEKLGAAIDLFFRNSVITIIIQKR